MIYKTFEWGLLTCICNDGVKPRINQVVELHQLQNRCFKTDNKRKNMVCRNFFKVHIISGTSFIMHRTPLYRKKQVLININSCTNRKQTCLYKYKRKHKMGNALDTFDTLKRSQTNPVGKITLVRLFYSLCGL